MGQCTPSLKANYMEFRDAMHNLVYFADRIKDLDREIVRTEVESNKLLAESVENGLICFEKANSVHEELERIKGLRMEIEEAEKRVREAREYLYAHLLPFEGYRIIYDYVPEQGNGRTCQVFLEEDEVKFI